MTSNPLQRFDDLLTEAQVCERYSGLVGPRELRKARQDGRIAFFAGRKGIVYYDPAAVALYLASKETTCRNADQKSSSSTEDIGSVEPMAPPSSTHTGMTEEADRLLDAHLRQKYSRRQKPA